MMRLLIPLTLLLVACGGDRPGGDGPATDGMADMAMPAVERPSLAMLPAMQAWADSLRRATPDALPAMLTEHRPRIDALLAAMAADMRATGMTGDAPWRALEDSVRADAEALSSLDGEALVLRARAHAGRLRRLLDRHDHMMRM